MVTLRRPERYGRIVVHWIALVMRLREPLSSSMMVLLLARGAGSALHCWLQCRSCLFECCSILSPVHLRLCATTSRRETRDKTLLNHTRSCKQPSVNLDFRRLDYLGADTHERYRIPAELQASCQKQNVQTKTVVLGGAVAKPSFSKNI